METTGRPLTLASGSLTRHDSAESLISASLFVSFIRELTVHGLPACCYNLNDRSRALIHIVRIQ